MELKWMGSPSHKVLIGEFSVTLNRRTILPSSCPSTIRTRVGKEYAVEKFEVWDDGTVAIEIWDSSVAECKYFMGFYNIEDLCKVFCLPTEVIYKIQELFT